VNEKKRTGQDRTGKKVTKGLYFTYLWRSWGFYVVRVSGYFLAKSDKIWVSEALRFFTAFYYQFTDDAKFNGTETAVVMIFISLLFFFNFAFSRFLISMDPSRCRIRGLMFKKKVI